MNFTRFRNQSIAKLNTSVPSIGRKISETFSTIESEEIPWTPLTKPLERCKVVIVTTAGIHHRTQTPFDILDPEGDPTYRSIDISRPISELVITHDFYDHKDAEKDINIVFPIERLRELKDEGFIGEVSRIHYGFLGHILGEQIQNLLNSSAPEVAQRLKMDGVDIALLTPG